MPPGLLNSTALTPPPGAAAPVALTPPPGAAAPVAGSPAAAPFTPPSQGLVPPPQAAGDPEPNVSPAEQSQYDDLVKQAYNVAYDDVPRLLESIGGQGDPVQGLAQTVANLFDMLVNTATRQGVNFDQETVLNAGAETMEDFADLAKTAGLHDFTEKEMESAAYLAAELYRNLQQNSGNLDPNEAAGNLENLKAAEASGTLEEILPGVGAAVGGTNPQGVPAGAPPALPNGALTAAAAPPPAPAPAQPPPSPLRGLVG